MTWLHRLAQRTVRAVLRFAYPEYETAQRQLALLSRAVAQVDKNVKTHERRQVSKLESIAQAVAGLATRADLERTRGMIDRHARVTARLLRRGDARGENSWAERRVLQRLDRLAAGTGPIVVGPWMGEVGFELLYWEPFVSWFAATYGVDPDRLIVLSRGGVSSWYSHVAPRYVDLLSYASPDEYREATNLAKKQRGVAAFDMSLLRRVGKGERWGRVRLLHPQLMYRLFWEFWKGTAPAERVTRYSSYTPLASRGLANLGDRPPGLPASYVAARFYFSSAFPDTPENRAFVGDILSSLVEVTDVVLLNTPFRIDDHSDYAAGRHPRIHTVDDMPPERNLAIQTAVISDARAFVGTYGGYAYLAPFCRVPSVSFYSTRTFFRHHLDLAQQIVAELGTASLVVLDTRDTAVVRSVLLRTSLAWPDVAASDRALKP
jgi:hypothetical protein